MRRALFIACIAAVGAAVAAKAGLDVPPAPAPAPDMSGYATKSDVGAIQSQIPQPAATVPPTEMTGGSVGTPGTYRPADARQPRITRSKTVVLAADGTATFDWTAQGALATPGQVALAPVYTGAGVPKCWVTALSATAASIKCVVESVALVSVAGINIGSVTNSAPSGLQVGVIALPPS